MLRAITQFRNNVKLTRDQGQNASLVKQTTSLIDVSDIYRGQIVFAVSALDQFVHETIRTGMVEIANGIRPVTDAYNKFVLPIEQVQEAIVNQSFSDVLNAYVHKRHREHSFQSPDNIKKFFKLISQKTIWEEVASALSSDATSVKRQLEAIVDRRNKIAHESDIDPANPSFKWPISESMASETIDFIERIGEAIYVIVTTQ